ncbi:hypothetical protein JL722_1798 [Aureococcus anophagefferens]|nr:hypothetical protein JL722_1798 [Aureococcus anophagefferens]
MWRWRIAALLAALLRAVADDAAPACAVPPDRVDDDYCDCPVDGGDEPHTSACASAALAARPSFACAGGGAGSAAFLPASRVGDGVCDCCDGADEPAGFCGDDRAALGPGPRPTRRRPGPRRPRASRRCAPWPARPARARPRPRGSSRARGRARRPARRSTPRVDEAREAHAALKRADGERAIYKELRLDALSGSELRRLVADLAEAKAATLVRLARVANGLPAVEPAEAEAEPAADEPATEAEALEAEAADEAAERSRRAPRRRAPRRRPDDYGDGDYGSNSFAGLDDEDFPDDEYGDIPDDVFPDDDYKSRRYDDDDFDYGKSYEPADPRLDVDGHADPDKGYVSAAQKKALKKLEGALRDLEEEQRKERRLDKARDALGDDDRYGRDSALWPLRETCISKKFSGYKYEVCFFKGAKQGSTRLGDYQRSTKHANNVTATLVYEHGEHCWNGPSRSLAVTLVCGAETGILDVDEPSTCVYAATVETPAVCVDADAPDVDCAGYKPAFALFDGLDSPKKRKKGARKLLKKAKAARVVLRRD